MRNRLAYILIGISVAIILGTIIYIFGPDLSYSFSKIFSNTSTKTGIKKSEGVPRSISYRGRLEEARKLIDQEYFTLAPLELISAIKEKPDFIEPYLILGEVYLRTNDLRKLNSLLIELENKFPENKEIIVLEARKLITEGKFNDVFKSLEQAERKDLSPALNFYLAVLNALQNKHETAKEILSELNGLPVIEKKYFAIDVNDTSIEEVNVSITSELAKKVQDLLVTYEEFEGLSDGKNPHLFALLAKKLAENNEGRLAREFSDTAIKEDVAYIDAWIIRGYANLLLKDFGNALQDLRHAYELDPIRPQTHYFLALTLYESGNEEEAALYFEKALEHNFEFSSEIRWKLVSIFNKQQKYDQVIILYKNLLNENVPEEVFTSAINTMINLVKSPETALEVTTKLINESPDNVFLMNMHAWTLTSNRYYSEAEEFLKKAEGLEPENPRTFFNFGILYETQKRFEEAKGQYNKSYELSLKSSNKSVLKLAAQKYNQLIGLDDTKTEFLSTELFEKVRSQEQKIQ